MATKNVMKHEMYYRPWEPERAIGRSVDHYDHRRRHAASRLFAPPAVHIVLRVRS